MTQPSLLLDIGRRGIAPVCAGEDARAFTEWFAGRIDRAEVFVADNVASWFHYHRHGELDVARDLPCIVPPYTDTWIEWQNYWDDGCDRFGMLLLTQDFHDDDDGGTASVRQRLADMLANKTNVIGEKSDMIPQGPLRWLVHAMAVGRTVGGRPVGPVKIWSAGLTPEGAVAPTTDGHLCNYSIYPEGTEIKAAKAFAVLMTEGFLALSFLNCRNVVAEEHLPSRQTRRALERRGLPVLIFRTINIEPMKTVLRTEGQLEKVGLQRSLHICRGHFAHYTEEKPLFGRYSGQFWVPSHVRGSAEVGTVVKDYAVKAPGGGTHD
jgi:hypothetical protein